MPADPDTARVRLYLRMLALLDALRPPRCANCGHLIRTRYGRWTHTGAWTGVHCPADARQRAQHA